MILEEITVLAGPELQDTLFFKLHQGAVVHHERSEHGWSFIHLSREKRSWIKFGSLERIIRRKKQIEIIHYSNIKS